MPNRTNVISIKFVAKSLGIAKERANGPRELSLVAGSVAFLAGGIEVQEGVEQSKQFIIDCGFDVREKDGAYYPKYE